MKKITILCVLVLAISLVPVFAADTNNTTTNNTITHEKQLKHQYKHQKGLNDCCDNKNSTVKAKHQHKYHNSTECLKINCNQNHSGNCTGNCTAK